ncbi:DUF4406 domain-containing protein [Salmonella enterica]|nr:DUF4406 domain-containing protein [Salmonella enterica]ELS3893309.1 DUF4406 domain-containing protein [Salmonella enterica]
MNNQKDKKKVVFICGPMTGYENYNRDAFMRKEMELTSRGATALNPAMLPGGLEHGQYLTIRRGMIRVSDVICLLPGWENSEGAKREVVYAMRRNIWPMWLDEECREKLKAVLWDVFIADGYDWRSALPDPVRPQVKGWDEMMLSPGFRCRTLPVKDAKRQRAKELALLPRQGVVDVAEKLTWISGVLEGVLARFAPLPLKLDELGEAKAATDEAYNALCRVLADEVME